MRSIDRKQEFRKHELPEFLRRLRLLGMTIDDVVKAWEERQDTKGWNDAASKSAFPQPLSENFHSL